MTDQHRDPKVIVSSIELLRSVSQCVGVFDEKFLQRVNRQLEEICARYTRTYERIDLGVIDIPQPSLTKLNLVQDNELFATQQTKMNNSKSARTARARTALSVRVPPSRPGSSARQMSARVRSRAQTGRSASSFKKLLNGNL